MADLVVKIGETKNTGVTKVETQKYTSKNSWLKCSRKSSLQIKLGLFVDLW